ncbi:ABC transporter permease [Paenibacillus sediminis]|uniref:ABC-2 type transport system permease protein n=1 Tax=Paenibacillus sediminis TaxID=664909 RepID=A0ABS4H2Z9_9BACL|nr:ABC transporter permease [Paenibacillus sediminis]MBP1936909.1 ABC-2 type transport system permease protein [Paenibacillus sediminis]
MNNIWTIARFELLRLIRIRSVLLNLFLLPLILIFILGAALSGVWESSTPKDTAIKTIKVGIVYESAEKGAVTSGLGTFLQSAEIKKLILPETAESRESAETEMRSGKIDYAVVIPADFDTNVAQGKGASWDLIRGKDSSKNLVAETVFDSFLDETNYRQAASVVMGPNAAVAAMSQGAQQHESFVDTGKLSNQGTSYSASQYYAASMLIMFLLYSGMTASSSLYLEKENNTLSRLQAMPISSFQIFAGKIVGLSIVAFAQVIVIITFTHFLYGVNWGNNPLLLGVICVLLVIASMTLAVMITLSVKSRTAANSIMQIVTIAMTFISGGFSPLPEGIFQNMGQISVNYWGMQGMLRMMLHEDVSQIMQTILMLGGICVLFIGAATFTYRKVGGYRA